MAKYSNTKAKINEKITTNTTQAITGNVLNEVLQTMVDSLGADYQFGGLVQPGSSFTAGEQPVVFLATTPGTYTNFGSLVVADGEVALLVWSGTAWSKQTPDIATRTEVSQLGQETNSNFVSIFEQLGKFRPAESYTLDNYYLNAQGVLTYNTNTSSKYAHFDKGAVVRVYSETASAYGGYAIYESEPNIGSTPYKQEIKGYDLFIMPIDGYVLVTGQKVGTASLYSIDEMYGVYDNFDKIDELLDQASPVVQSDNKLAGFVYTDGRILANEYQELYYARVKVGTIIQFAGEVSGNYRAGYSYNEPTLGSSIDVILPTDTISPIVSTVDGYFCISGVKDSVSLYIRQVDLPTKIKQIIEEQDNSDNFWEVIPESGVIDNYYIYKDGRIFNNVSCILRYWPVSQGDVLKIPVRPNSAFAACAFFASIPTTSSTPSSVIDADVTEVTAPIDGYIGVAHNSKVNGVLIDKLLQPFIEKKTTIKVVTESSSKKIYQQGKEALKNFITPNCIFIGDSISTKDNYQWKGLLEKEYDFTYVRDIENQLAPANGGIPLIPPENEPANDAEKSIWYRCANNRMSIYAFNMISLFGGTNDMTDSSLAIGSIDDVPYVDDTTEITSELVTDERPSTLTFSSAFMGCILMLQRDFPGVPIVIPTVLPCQGDYGNWSAGDFIASEAIARLQMQIASKYNLIAMPFYWGIRKVDNANNNILGRDGVHPNYQCAIRMKCMFAENAGLRIKR